MYLNPIWATLWAGEDGKGNGSRGEYTREAQAS